MAGNKYQQYLNEDRVSSRSSRIGEQVNNTLKFLTVTSAVVAGGAGARHLYRSGALDGAMGAAGRTVNNAADRVRPIAMRTGAFTNAASRTVKEAGVLKTLSGRADDLFESKLRRNLERGHSALRKPLSGVDTDIERLMVKRGHLKSEAIKSYIEGHRLDSVTGHLGKMIGEDSHLFKDIDHVLRTNKKNKALMDHANHEHLFQFFTYRGLVEKHGEEAVFGAAQSLDEILRSYRGKPGEWLKPLSTDHLRQKAQQVGSIVDEGFMRSLEPKEGIRNRFLERMGIRRATVEDALAHPEWFEGSAQFAASRTRKRVDGAQFVPRDTYKKLQTLVSEHPDASKLTLGKSVMFDIQSGDLVDYRYISDAVGKATHFAAHGLQAPFVNINPLRLAHISTIEGVKGAEPMSILRRGTNQQFLTGSTDPLTQDILYSAGRAYNIKTGDMIKDNIYLASSRYGMLKRMAQNMGELGDQKTGNWVQNAFDIGLQERPNQFSRVKGAFGKFKDTRWEPNLIHGMKRQVQETGEVSPDVAEAAYKKIYDTLHRKARPLDEDMIKRLTPTIQEMFPGLTAQDIAMETDQQVMATLGKLMQIENAKVGQIYSKRTGLLGQMRANATLYEKNVDVFETIKQVSADPELVLPNFLESVQPGGSRMIDKYTDTKRIIHQEILSQLEAHRVDFRGALGDISSKQETLLSDLHALGSMRRSWSSVYGLDGDTLEEAALSKAQALSSFAATIVNPTENQQVISREIQDAVKRYNPWWGYGPQDKIRNPLSDSPYIVMNKARNPIREINEVVKQGGDFSDTLKTLADTTVGQLGVDFGFGFRAGRKNLDKVTTATAIPYYYLERLNQGVSRTGLSLSQKSLGSTQDVFMSAMLKRYGAVALGLGALGYANYEMENLTGSQPSDVLAKTYVNMTLGAARFSDFTGITEMNKMLGRIMPGSDKLFKNPVGGAVKYGSFGIIGDDRDYDELHDYWTKGSDPVRKGRWWGLGSSSPWYGDKIDHWKPNWYRRVTSDYKYTDVLYGSRDEYWANNWMPTPRYPLAPVNRFLVRPNHWVNKHRESRPYPVYGGYSELNQIPLVGPLLNSTVGHALNPHRKRRDLEKAHTEYLETINESIKQKQLEQGSAMVQVSPSGRVSMVPIYGYEQEGGYSVSGHIPTDSWGEGIGVPIAPTEDGAVNVVSPNEGFAPMQSGKIIAGADIENINKGIIARNAVGRPLQNNLESFRDPGYVEDLREAVDPTSFNYRFKETLHTITEMGGIYGFSITAHTGKWQSQDPVLPHGMEMTSMRRMFWEQQLGGAGADVSEIGRRFLPRKRTEREYNPFRNTMPEWMPGPEYMLDFQHGDPYAKITGGEYRLPGEGYESLNRLHPDMFGEYGALDRFKILADVAPYSDQYRYYKGVLSQYNQMDWLTDTQKQDISTIKDQVRQAKEKYDFTPYKFKHADIQEEYVTIDYMVDDITFVSRENPGNPIRLAGVKAPPQSDESDAAMMARAYLNEQLRPGKRVKVGLDADELFKVRDDTMSTMRAVVYDSQGMSISARLARGRWNAFMGFIGGESVAEADWDDHSATTVRALYTDSEITLGKAWEFISHLDTPFHTKLLQNRSPIEQYKRKEIYGKNWRTWRNPIRDFVRPAYESIIEKNPLVSAGLGAFMGGLFGTKGIGRPITATIGAAVTATASSLRAINETARRVSGDSEYTWIPKRRRKEREIEEYFDVLEYVKYKGLYERTRKLAMKEEGVDVSRFLESSDELGRRTGNFTRALEDEKRWIKINMANPMVDSDEAKEELDEINNRLRGLSEEQSLVNLGPISMQAIRYKSAYESTLYGADPYGDTIQIHRALPKKDREFFKEFMLAPPEEREEILRLVPENQRRFYQAKWGLDVDERPDLEDYFKGRYLPSASWEGWRPDVSLEAVKLKVVQNEALDMSEFGFYPGDERAASGAPEVKPFKPTGFLNIGRLNQTLRGMGLKNVDIRQAVEPGDENGITVNVNLNKDRRDDITGIMNSNMRSIFSA